MGERFVDRVVVVTGGGSGLGEAMSVAFASEGARVGVLDIEGEAADRVAERVGGRAYPGDVSDECTVIERFAAVDRELGPVDVLVNNAGIAPHRPELARRALAALEARTAGRRAEPLRATSTLEVADLDRMLRVHVHGAFLCTREALRRMEERRSGAILMMSSVAGILGAPAAMDYSAAKGALIAMTKSLAQEVVRVGIRVNAIAPGLIDTPMVARTAEDPELARMWVDAVGMGRMGRPEEVAALALHLCSDEASYTTGQIVSPNGGIPM
jgi:3-oxoacyl-[acyl-carrier protein] reductase